MKKTLTLLFGLLATLSAFATHIAGGELYYEYLGAGAGGADRYRVTMKLFRECSSVGASLNGESVNIGVYSSANLVRVVTLQLTQQFTGNPPTIQHVQGSNPCLNPDPVSCYQVGTYSGVLEIARNLEGYTLSWIRYTRMDNIENVSGNGWGATFVTRIPGSGTMPTGNNSSPRFLDRDTTIACKSTGLNLSYKANDPDGDSLVYKFTNAFDGVGGSATDPNPAPPGVLQLNSLSYKSPYTGLKPLGPNVTINSKTGDLEGNAPATPGKYVVCVLVEEWRNGVKISEHRKDFILSIGDCSISAADLDPDKWSCDGYTWTFENKSTASNITSYLWQFGDGGTSSQASPTHTYATANVYKVKLFVVAQGGCTDSAEMNLHVFPGFQTKFTTVGKCFQSPIQFKDATTTAFGTVNSWRWNFGDGSTSADTATHKDTAWKYPTAGNYAVTLISTNSKGCTDTTVVNVEVSDKPAINLPFRDTLICSIDTLPLIATSATPGATFSWTPNYNILNANTGNPLVFPKDTTRYRVTVTESGCVDTASILVNVLDFITVDLGKDSSICLSDTFRLKPVSHALSYQWTASTGEVVASVKYPLVQPLTTTKYVVNANLGKCPAKDSVTITPVPYPKAVVSLDTTTICYGDTAQLHSTYQGAFFFWTPLDSMRNATTLNPIVRPIKTTTYILTATDTVGCPKPVSDTIVVGVIPPVVVFAGNDTSVVRGEPLQFNATSNFTSNTAYLWSPSTGLSNTTISNPVGTLNITTDSIRYRVTVTLPEGCVGEDYIVVKVFKTAPEIFVPSGFTPNGDGRNDILRAITVGIRKLDYFRVFNRWGQLIFETNDVSKGWDGTVSGTPQASGTFVFMAQGKDYAGRVVFRKGTTVLIR